MNVSCVQHTSLSFPHVKKKLKTNTLKIGSAVTSFYFLSSGVSLGTSALLGSVSSFAYIHMLSNHVENIETTKFQKQMIVPVAMAIIESTWNHSTTPFDLDFLTTLVGFFAYKLALFEIILDIVKEDFKPVEDETLKIYNDLSDD